MDPAARDRERVYEILAELRATLPVQHLASCTGARPWPRRGNCLFFEPASLGPTASRPASSG